ncbi:nitroreductase family protein [Candidatus Dojkabacteria bacterium]|nr:nitroreductase family protein [Candidatus Dojkabacteria bacterium]
MDQLENIKSRRSVRDFKKGEIPEEIIEKLKQALIWAPSAGNLQSRKFYFVYNDKIKKELANAALGQMFVKEAPLVIAACADPEKSASKYGERGRNLYCICDTAISIQNLMLQAASEGLGTCWVGAFDEKRVAKILNLQKDLRPIAIVPIGYPSVIPEKPERFTVNEIIGEIN